MSISDFKLQKLRAMIDDGISDDFYDWKDWLRVREDVLNLDHRECQFCKKRGRHRAAVIVHHVKHLRDRPDLALSIFDSETGERQLVSLCRACHEEQHPDRGLKRLAQSRPPLTEERWD